MLVKSFFASKRALFVAMGLLISANLAASDSSSSSHPHHQPQTQGKQFIIPAQAFLQDLNQITVKSNQPIPYTTTNLLENVKLKDGDSVFKIKVPGKYSFNTRITVENPVIGQTYTLAAFINGQTIVEFEFPEEAFSAEQDFFAGALLYLNKGDEVFFAFINSPDVTIGERTFDLAVLNNTK